MITKDDKAPASDRQRQYWVDRGPEPVVSNPIIESLSRRLPHRSAPRLTAHEWTLSDSVSQGILRVCNNSDLSLYILLVTMLKVVIARCTGEMTVTILSPTYHPERVVSEANLVMFQDQVQLSKDVRTNILETRRTVVGAYSNQAITLAEIHSRQLAHDVIRNNPLCILRNIHSVATIPSQCPLVLQFSRSEHEIKCLTTYDSARLSADLVAEFCLNLQQFIEGATSDYTIAAEAVDWLHGERLERVSTFSKGFAVDIPEATLGEIFEQQVGNTPGALAVIHGAQSVTYAELDTMAAIIANNLMEMGVRSGDTIGLLLSSSIDRVATMIAALRVGAVFAPFSLGEPPKRLSRLLEMCRPKLLVTVRAENDLAPHVQTVEFSRLFARRDTVLTDRTELSIRTDAPAYIIFTSGTSGTPKAVCIEHRGIVNAIVWKVREHAFAPGRRVLPLFGYEFDGFILNVFAPLCSGATIVLLDDDERHRPKCIATCIDGREVTDMVTAPILYEAVLGYVNEGQLRSLQRVTLAGESASPETIARSKRIAPHIQVSNEYGPTESSVVSTYCNELAPDSVSVIGKPIDNVQVYILDDRGNLVPPGVVGEIYIGGRGLARGYLAGNALTQESFTELRGERLYRTGDLGRWLVYGNIEFCGRRERHIKLRGQRVDLEEVRTTILKYVGIKDVVVLLVGDLKDGLLCACVVADSQVTIDGIETFLCQEIPPHMLPNRIILFEALPLNAGGKVDLPALQLKLQEAVATGESAVPSNQIERQLVEIWRRILEIERIGMDESFFSLGGHSLRVVRLLTDIHEVFGVELRLDQVFSATTVRRLSRIIALHQPENTRASSSTPHEGVESANALSPAQERMLALTTEHRVSYNLPVLFSLDGNLDIQRLQSALQAVVDRHDSLRASFHLIKDKWVQRFSDTLPVTISEQTLNCDGDIGREAQLLLAPFDIEKAPLLRVGLYTVQGRHAYLLFVFHHIIIDELSLAIVLRELAMFYNGERVNGPSPHSYSVYVNSQQRRRQSEEYQACLVAVTKKLRKDNIEPLRLPFDHPPAARCNNEGGLVRRDLSREIMAVVRQFCANSEITEFMFFMAVFGLLLSKYTHQTTMIIGAPVSIRSNAAARDLVGLCLNTVPFKLVVPRTATFREYLRNVSSGIIDDLGRSQVEFDDVVKALKVDRHFGENPLFSTMLNIIDSNVTRLSLNDVKAMYLPLHNGTSKFDLLLELDLREHESSFSFEFSTDRFQESTIRRLSDSLITLLENVVTNPDVSICSLQILGAGEGERLLEWNGWQEIGTYDDGSVVSHFERRVLERPSDIAIVFGNDNVTYDDLNAKANRLAHKLRSVGCREDDIVAVLCERSPATIVAIMGVQKSGAAHLPLDPFYPMTRTREMLSDSGACTLITDQDVSALNFTGTVIGVDADLSDCLSTNPGISRRPESLAYVLYTSGTTGGPKGVLVAQRNLVTLVNRARAQLSIDDYNVWTLFHSVCFDVSVWEMFGALLSGGRLVIVPRTIAADPHRLLDLIEKNSVSVLCQPPSAFYLLAGAMLRSGRPTSIRYVILGGEAVKTESLKEWYRHHTMVKLINGYGITETTIYSTFKSLTNEDVCQHARSIGRPLSGTYVYVLAPDLSLCPIGVVGELYIGGLGVGRGYVRRPELTRDRFVDDPFKPGHLLYRSGDLAKWLASGDIEYICRADTQVKVRGYRVELSEIEAVLVAYPTIRESVVLAEEQSGTTQLIGFFTSDVKEDLAQLRSQLEKTLPNYMVPSRLIQVDRIPLTANGKVDRAQLLSTRAVVTVTTKRSEPSMLEKLLINTWADVVGISADEIGPDDSFFAIGGDSIGANLVVRMLANHGLQVELLDLFENPKLDALANAILSKNTGRVNAALANVERTAYWKEIASARLRPLFEHDNRNVATQWREMTTVDVPLGDLRTALALAQDGFELRELLLTTLCVSLRMWSGSDACRILLLEGLPGKATEIKLGGVLLVTPLILTIKDINFQKENLASVRESARRSAIHQLEWNEAVANPAYRSALENGVVFHYSEIASLEDTRPTRQIEIPDIPNQAYELNTVPRSCMIVDCVVSNSTVALAFTAPVGVIGAERFQFLAQTFKFAFCETVGALPTAPTLLQKAQVLLDVQPFNDVFFRDCTLQALVAAVGYFGRDFRALLVNTIGICVRDVGRSRGLRVHVKYLERQTFDEVLGKHGISLHRCSGSADICNDLLESLSRGSLGIVKVDCYFVEKQRELFQRKHGDHTILVCGYDQERRFFEIIDNNAARAVQYRRTTIGFDELRAAYEGYQRIFNPHCREVSSFTVLEEPKQYQGQYEPTDIQHSALETLRLAQGWRDEEQAALGLLRDDFCALSASERLLIDHIEQLLFTIGEIISAKRLLSYQLGNILKHPQLAQLADEMISRLQVVYGLITKLHFSQDYVIKNVQSVQTKLNEVQQLDLAYTESLTRLLEDSDL